VLPNIQTAVFDFFEHGGIDGFEKPALKLRVYQQVGLRSPIVGKMQALIIQLEPLINPAEIEGQQIIPQLVSSGIKDAGNNWRHSDQRP